MPSPAKRSFFSYCRELVPGLPPCRFVGAPPAEPGIEPSFFEALKSACELFVAGCPVRFMPVVGAPVALLPNWLPWLVWDVPPTLVPAVPCTLDEFVEVCPAADPPELLCATAQEKLPKSTPKIISTYFIDLTLGYVDFNETVWRWFLNSRKA